MSTVSTFDNMLIEDKKVGLKKSAKKCKDEKKSQKGFSPWTKMGRP